MRKFIVSVSSLALVVGGAWSERAVESEGWYKNIYKEDTSSKGRLKRFNYGYVTSINTYGGRIQFEGSKNSSDCRNPSFVPPAAIRSSSAQSINSDLISATASIPLNTLAVSGHGGGSISSSTGSNNNSAICQPQTGFLTRNRINELLRCSAKTDAVAELGKQKGKRRSELEAYFWTQKGMRDGTGNVQVGNVSGWLVNLIDFPKLGELTDIHISQDAAKSILSSVMGARIANNVANNLVREGVVERLHGVLSVGQGQGTYAPSSTFPGANYIASANAGIGELIVGSSPKVGSPGLDDILGDMMNQTQGGMNCTKPSFTIAGGVFAEANFNLYKTEGLNISVGVEAGANLLLNGALKDSYTVTENGNSCFLLGGTRYYQDPNTGRTIAESGDCLVKKNVYDGALTADAHTTYKIGFSGYDPDLGTDGFAYLFVARRNFFAAKFDWDSYALTEYGIGIDIYREDMQAKFQLSRSNRDGFGRFTFQIRHPF